MARSANSWLPGPAEVGGGTGALVAAADFDGGAAIIPPTPLVGGRLMRIEEEEEFEEEEAAIRAFRVAPIRLLRDKTVSGAVVVLRGAKATLFWRGLLMHHWCLIVEQCLWRKRRRSRGRLCWGRRSIWKKGE